MMTEPPKAVAPTRQQRRAEARRDCKTTREELSKMEINSRRTNARTRRQLRAMMSKPKHHELIPNDL